MSFLKNIFGRKKTIKAEPLSYDAFWDWFRQHEKEFYSVLSEGKNMEAGFVNKFSPKLSEVSDIFFFLAGKLNDTTAELVLTAEGVIRNMVFVEDLVNAAPVIAGWQFTAHKPAVDSPDMVINMSGYKFGPETISFYSNEHADRPDEIDITLVHKDYSERSKQAIMNGCFIYLDNYLGELKSVSVLDNVSFTSVAEAKKELVPIEKLPAFLEWREKEFVEKYEGLRHNTEADNYAGMEGELENGRGIIAIINQDLMRWDAKASHPWMAFLILKYDGSEHNGMPAGESYELLNTIEDEIQLALKDSEGYLNVGRQTGNDLREVYFACRDFRKPSRVFAEITQKYGSHFEISFEIFKDKYWLSLDRYTD